jgi:ribosomal-protein-alanine N-acetyltransferase
MPLLLETPRLRLRHISVEDAAFVFELMNEPAYLQYIGDRGIRTLEDARLYIAAKFIASYEQHSYGLYLVEAKTESLPIGISGFVKREVLAHPDIGFAFLQRFWSQGYAKESAVAVLEYGRTVLGFNCILGVTSPSNLKSIGLLKNIGLEFEKTIRLPGYSTESLLFSSEVNKTP